jgi:hypothetical protein
MPAPATSGYTFPAGVKLEYSTDGSTYTEITDLKSLKPPPWTRGKSKTTNLQSTGRTHTYEPGWTEPGEATCTFYFKKAQMAGLITLNSVKDPAHFRITFPLIGTEATNSKLEFDGYLAGIDWDQMTIDSEDKVSCPGRLQASGGPVFTSGA